jgi:hypothetical protein
MKQLTNLIHQVRERYDADEYDTALLMAEKAFKQSLTLEKDVEACWDLAESLFLLDKVQDSVNLVIHLAKIQNSVNSLVRCTEFMRMADRGEVEKKYSLEAIRFLRNAITNTGTNVILIKELVEFALDGFGWQVFENIEITDIETQRIISDIQSLSADFDLSDLDSRRYAYIVGGIAVLGLSEDHGDKIQSYWFLNADTYEVAWFIRRLITLIEHEGFQPNAISIGDVNAEPIAIVLSNKLKVPVLTTPPEEFCVLRIFSIVEDFKVIPPKQSNNCLTACFAVTLSSGWLNVENLNSLNVIGVAAPATLEWQNSLDIDLGLTSETTNQQILPRVVEKIADELTEELSNLPQDTALPDILSFYEKYSPAYRKVFSDQ